MIKRRLDATEQPVETQEQTACCYMRSNKYWITNPKGIVWESFHSLAGIPTFNEKKLHPAAESFCLSAYRKCRLIVLQIINALTICGKGG